MWEMHVNTHKRSPQRLLGTPTVRTFYTKPQKNLLSRKLISFVLVFKHSIFTSQKQYNIYSDQYVILFREIIEIPSADQTPKCKL